MEGMIQHFNDRINDLKNNMTFRVEGSPMNLENVLYELNETIGELETQITQMTICIKEEKEAIKKAQEIQSKLKIQNEHLEWINNNLPKYLPGNLINSNDVTPYNNSNNSNLNYSSQHQIQQQPIKEETKKEEENPFITTAGPPLQRNNNNIQKTVKSTATMVVSFITISEYDNLPKYIRSKRITRNKINDAIKDFNEVLFEKYNILKSSLSNLSRSEKKKYWEYKEVDIEETKGKVFITEQDLKATAKKINFKMDNIGRAIITTLRHLKKIKEVRGGGHIRYIVTSSC